MPVPTRGGGSRSRPPLAPRRGGIATSIPPGDLEADSDDSMEKVRTRRNREKQGCLPRWCAAAQPPGSSRHTNAHPTHDVHGMKDSEETKIHQAASPGSDRQARSEQNDGRSVPSARLARGPGRPPPFARRSDRRINRIAQTPSLVVLHPHVGSGFAANPACCLERGIPDLPLATGGGGASRPRSPGTPPHRLDVAGSHAVLEFGEPPTAAATFLRQTRRPIERERPLGSPSGVARVSAHA